MSGRASAGFTLIELVVALAISGLLVLTVYLAVGAATDAATRNEELQEAARRDRNARMVLATLLRSARIDPSRGEGFVGLDAADAPSGGDEIGFVSTPGVSLAGRRAGEPLRVRVRRTPEGIIAELEIARTLGPETTGVGAIDTLVLFPGADAMEIRYLDPEYGEWLDTWERSERLPGGIAFGFGRDRPIPALVLHLPVRPAPVGRMRPTVGDPVGGP